MVLVVLAPFAAAQVPVQAQDALQQPDPIENPFLELTQPRDWRITSVISLRACDVADGRFGYNNAETIRWEASGGQIWFPDAPTTANSLPLPQPSKAELFFAGVRVDLSTRTLSIDGTGARYIYGRFDEVAGADARFRIFTARRSYDVKYNEQLAYTIPWPTGDWPEVARHAFRAGYAVPYNPNTTPADNPMIAAIERWTGTPDPKARFGPAALAKVLTKAVVEHVQPNRHGVIQPAREWGVVADVGGFAVTETTVLETLRVGRGSQYEMAALLTSVMLHAGIPTRLVVGVMVPDEDDPRERNQALSDTLRAWVEFYLYDEANDRGGWIPIDPLQLRKRSSRTPPLERSWEFFGNNNDMNRMVPVSLDFHPPVLTTVFGPPALYGWNLEPTTPDCGTHAVNVSVDRLPKRGGSSSDRP